MFKSSRNQNIFINLLEFEIDLMHQVHTNLIYGNTNVELVVYNGLNGTLWDIDDYNQLLNMYPDFDIQLNRKLEVLNFLKSIMSYMESRV
jgi:hypothetical protein